MYFVGGVEQSTFAAKSRRAASLADTVASIEFEFPVGSSLEL